MLSAYGNYTNAPKSWIVWIVACIVWSKERGQSARDMVGRAISLLPVRVRIPIGSPVTLISRYFLVLPSLS